MEEAEERRKREDEEKEEEERERKEDVTGRLANHGIIQLRLGLFCAGLIYGQSIPYISLYPLSVHSIAFVLTLFCC